MGKMSKAKGLHASISTKPSESSPNQGYLKISCKRVAHGQEFEGTANGRKGLKSGEPFSSINHINLKA